MKHEGVPKGKAEPSEARTGGLRSLWGRGYRLGGLSGKLLLLTILFVMLAEVCIYVPSVANFRNNWLQDRLTTAGVAASVLAVLDAPLQQSRALRRAWHGRLRRRLRLPSAEPRKRAAQ